MTFGGSQLSTAKLICDKRVGREGVLVPPPDRPPTAELAEWWNGEWLMVRKGEICEQQFPPEVLHKEKRTLIVFAECPPCA